LLEGLEDEWALSARERHGERVIAVLERRAQAAEQRDDVREAVELTRRQVERDPFDEDAHRRLITRLDASGDRAAAIRSYRTLTERLRRELGVAPSRQTRELIEQLRAQMPAAPADGGRTPLIPGLLPLLGRDRELGELERTWHAVTAGTGATAVIRGEAGIGTTRLATELALRLRRARHLILAERPR
jgi:DNA-binding SARP family transcriptional activator